MAASAIVVSPGPKASSVTMRRSNGWTKLIFPSGRQNIGAAMRNDGSRKKIWLPKKTAGWRTRSNQTGGGAGGRGAMTGVSQGEKIALKQPNDVRRCDDERDAKSEPWPRCR